MIYLDNSATTQPTPAVANKIYTMLTETYGNASSFHRAGLAANAELRAARTAIAKTLSCEKEEILFTSGGTEANNLAVFGAVTAQKRKGNRIVTTAIEHESVLAVMDELEQQGFEVVRLMPDMQGNITQEQLIEAVNKETILVSMMYINNEIGTILPVETIKKAVLRAQAPALIHMDCVQAYGKIPLKPKTLGADLLTITAHKIHGPKGIGALYIRKGVRILPRQFGGAQEQKLRPGTEATPLIAGFGTAVSEIPNLVEQTAQMQTLNAYARTQLSAIQGVQLHNDENTSPFILSVYIPSYMTSQTLVQHFSTQYNICISSGSACAKGKKSHVLTAMKLPDRIIEHTVRISFSRMTTKADINALAAAVAETTEKYPI